MATAGDIVKAALRNLGVIASGDQPAADELADGLSALNEMMALWSADGLLIYSVTRENFTLTPGTASYTMGSGGAFNTIRPIQITEAFIRDSSGTDYPVDVKDRKYYERIEIKTTQGRPDKLYLAPEYPLAKVYLYPTPSLAEALYLDSWKALTAFATVDTVISLPDEYRGALSSNLAIYIAPEYSVSPSQALAVKAGSSKATITKLNMGVAPEVRFDPGLLTYRR